MEKKDVKPRFIRLVLLLLQFDFQINDRKEIENQVADHLSRLEDEDIHEAGEKVEIDDAFPYEHVLSTSQDLIPQFADFANYLASAIVSSYLSFHLRKKIIYDVKKVFGMSLTYNGVVPM